VVARTKAWVYGISLAGDGSLSLVSVVFCQVEVSATDRSLSLVSVVFSQVEVSATDRSLAQRSPPECGESEAEISRDFFTHHFPSSSVSWRASSE
jgi:hypothetical protein